MQNCLFYNKKCLNFGIKFKAEIFNWMQSGFDGFDFFETLVICHISKKIFNFSFFCFPDQVVKLVVGGSVINGATLSSLLLK